jgi:hypothetical protein
MISAWHLAWIAPLCTVFGFVICAMFKVGAAADLAMLPIDYDERQFYFD